MCLREQTLGLSGQVFIFSGTIFNDEVFEGHFLWTNKPQESVEKILQKRIFKFVSRIVRPQVCIPHRHQRFEEALGRWSPPAAWPHETRHLGPSESAGLVPPKGRMKAWKSAPASTVYPVHLQ